MINVQNKTKIVATIGPASSDKQVLQQMIENGLNVCRINFSHGAHEVHEKVIQTVRELNDELKTHTAILGDLQGPKLRVGEVENNGVELKNGAQLIITTKKMVGTAEKVYITYQDFAKDVKPGERVLLDDGKLMLEVVETNKKDEVVTKVLHGGILSSKKGVNLPNTAISLPCLTEKDREDLEFALKHNIAWIGLSFVRSARDIIELRHLIDAAQKDTKIIAKIEKPEAVEDIDDIIKAADGIMVARGDLGVEIPMEEVPLVQKSIVTKCREYGKPVIIATQMMESMITSISPTRAEVNDVANAVLDGADAVMLSGETSVGKFPLEVIQAMYKIIVKTEREDKIYYKEHLPNSKPSENRYVTDHVCYNAALLSKHVDAKAIVTMTFSGYTAFKMSSLRPKANVFMFTSNIKILNTMNLVWGVRCFFYDKFVSTDHTIDDIKYILKKNGFVVDGDYIVHLASMPITSKGTTNMVKISKIGE